MPHEPWTPPTPRPESFTTERLVVRKYEHDDAEPVFRAVDDDRDSYLPWLPWVRVDNLNVGQCHDNIERFRRDYESWPCPEFTLGAFLRDGGQIAGGVGFRPKAPELHSAEIGYWTRTDMRGRGICTEAVGGLITWLFTPQSEGGWGLRRVDILCAAANLASAAVPRKLNMRLEMAAVQERYVEPIGYHDTRAFGILASEWDAARHRARDDRAPGLDETAPD